MKEAVAEDPDLSPDNPLFTTLDQPGLGRFPVPGSPISFSSHARTAPEPAPPLGLQTEEVLAEVAGLDSMEIARLFDSGTVTGPRLAIKPAA